MYAFENTARWAIAITAFIAAITLGGSPIKFAVGLAAGVGLALAVNKLERIYDANRRKPRV